jgi:hypothetical protein
MSFQYPNTLFHITNINIIINIIPLLFLLLRLLLRLRLRLLLLLLLLLVAVVPPSLVSTHVTFLLPQYYPHLCVQEGRKH